MLRLTDGGRGRNCHGSENANLGTRGTNPAPALDAWLRTTKILFFSFSSDSMGVVDRIVVFAFACPY